MRRFVEEADRGQWTLLPECLDDFIDESNPVRVIDVFVGALDLAEMSFEGVEPAATGRPSYHPSVLLKLYIYGYLNRVQSSRRLEREAGRNVEVMWLLGRLAPDHKTIADFRSRSMATSGRGSGVVGYNVQVAVDTEHHLIVAHEVTNSGSDRAQLANMAKQAKEVLKAETLEAVADRGYFSSPEILACHEAGITVTLPKPQTSGAKSQGRFGKQDFAYLPEEDAYRCPAGERLPYRYTNEEDGKMLRRYWTTACQNCSLKSQCTTGPERRITRWEHEHLLEAVQQRLDSNPQAMRQRRETVEHPFGTMKARMGATHFLTKTLPKVAAEMALSVLAYNLTRVMNIVGIKPLMAAIVA
jgi:transposase